MRVRTPHLLPAFCALSSGGPPHAQALSLIDFFTINSRGCLSNIVCELFDLFALSLPSLALISDR